MLLRTRRGLLLLLLLVIGSIYLIKHYFWDAGSNMPPAQPSFSVSANDIYVFPGLKDETPASVLPPAQHKSWRDYSGGAPSAMAILLTDTEAHWLGIAHGLQNIGIPFTITTSTGAALQHKVILVYPAISGKLLNKDELQAIAAVPRNGGTLIACDVYGGGLQDIFAYKDIAPSAERNILKLQGSHNDPELGNIFGDVINHEIIMSDSADDVPTVGYTQPRTPLISFEDGTGCLIYKDYGAGKAYALGLDIGNYFLRSMDGRAFDANRAYANKYDAGVDVLLRTLKYIYCQGNNEAVTIAPTPEGKPFTLTITHDIDFTKSIQNAALYAEMEAKNNVKATYFIQTKYIKDWNDDIFFKQENMSYLQRVHNAGMEVASHSVSHSRTFAGFPIGSGSEHYPEYQPFVKERLVTYNGSVLGELRVSKFLLGHFTNDKIVSFRPGHLQYPQALPQALEATGYHNSSSITAGNAQTNLPFTLTYNRKYDGETKVTEIPIAVEDELGLPMLQRFDSTVLYASKLAKYGGVMNILIHTNELGQKFEYEQKVIAQFKDRAWITTIATFGDWWRKRAKAAVSVEKQAGTCKVTVTCKGDNIQGLTLQVPARWRMTGNNANIHQNGNLVIIDNLKEQETILFSCSQ